MDVPVGSHINFFSILLVLNLFQIVESSSSLVKTQDGVPFGNIVKVSEGNVLQKTESLLSTVATKNEEECWINCVWHERCLSLNVIIVNQTCQQCELFNYTGINVNASLVPKRNGYYAQLQDHCYGCYNGGTCVTSSSEHKCACVIGYKGDHCEKRVNQDCSTLKASGYHDNGVYQIDPDGKGSFPVLCDMKTDGGGWVVIHKRYDASVSFNHNWNGYKNGFGEMKTGNFWLGNEYTHRLTAAKPTQGLIELEDANGLRTFAKYSSFGVQSETDLYRLDVSGYSGTAGNALHHSKSTWRSNGMAFSTPDRDNDKYGGSCAAERSCGWWFNWCAAGLLTKVNMDWLTLRNNNIKKASMKIKPSS